MKKKHLLILISLVLIFSLTAIVIAAECTHPNVRVEEIKGGDSVHTKWCTECGDYLGTESHTEVWTILSSSHSSVCSECDQQIVEEESHSFTLKSLSLGHWLECEECEYTKDEELHTFSWQYDSSKHWQCCDDCDYKKDEELHNFTSEFDDLRHWQECDECGHIKNREKHSFGNIFSIVEDYHISICLECAESIAQAHVLSATGRCLICDGEFAQTNESPNGPVTE